MTVATEQAQTYMEHINDAEDWSELQQVATDIAEVLENDGRTEIALDVSNYWIEDFDDWEDRDTWLTEMKTRLCHALMLIDGTIPADATSALFTSGNQILSYTLDGVRYKVPTKSWVQS